MKLPLLHSKSPEYKVGDCRSISITSVDGQRKINGTVDLMLMDLFFLVATPLAVKPRNLLVGPHGTVRLVSGVRNGVWLAGAIFESDAGIFIGYTAQDTHAKARHFACLQLGKTLPKSTPSGVRESVYYWADQYSKDIVYGL